MKLKQEMELMCGVLILARLAVFRVQPHFLISTTKGRSV
jgi:hypothetical protein